MYVLLNVGEHQPLPIQRQSIRGALGGGDNAAPLGKGIYPQMHLGHDFSEGGAR